MIFYSFICIFHNPCFRGLPDTMLFSKEIRNLFPTDIQYLEFLLWATTCKNIVIQEQCKNIVLDKIQIPFEKFVWLLLNYKDYKGFTHHLMHKTIVSEEHLAKIFLKRFYEDNLPTKEGSLNKLKITLFDLKKLAIYLFTNHPDLNNIKHLRSFISHKPDKKMGKKTKYNWYVSALYIFVKNLNNNDMEFSQFRLLVKDKKRGLSGTPNLYQKFNSTPTYNEICKIIAKKIEFDVPQSIIKTINIKCLLAAEYRQFTQILPVSLLKKILNNPDADMTPSWLNFRGNLITLENLGEPFWYQNYGKTGDFIRPPGSDEWVKLEFKSVPRDYAEDINAFLNTCDVVRISPGCYFCKAQATGSRKDDARVCTRCLFEKHTGTKVPGTSRLTITGCNPTASDIIKFFQSQQKYDATKTTYEIWVALNEYLLGIAAERGEYDTADYLPSTFVSLKDKCVECNQLVGEKGGNILYRLHANCALASIGKTFADVHNLAIQVLSNATKADFRKTDITTMGVNAFRLIQDMRIDGCPYKCMVCGSQHASCVVESFVYKHVDGKLYLALPENGVIIDTLTENPINDDLYPELIQKFFEKIKEFVPRTHGSLTKGAAARH